MSHALNIECFVLGPWQTNCYVVWCEGQADCWIVDAGYEPEPMIQFIQQRELQPTMVVLTHAHLDHMAGLNACREAWPNLGIAIHEAEREFLTDANLNLSGPFGLPMVGPEPTQLLTGDETLRLGEHAFELRHTPGHSPGGITLYQAEHEVAIVGDALFAGSIGRTDFPTSDGPTLLQSIRDQLLTLPGPTRVLPGHGPETTIEAEKGANPFL